MPVHREFAAGLCCSLFSVPRCVCALGVSVPRCLCASVSRCLGVEARLSRTASLRPGTQCRSQHRDAEALRRTVTGLLVPLPLCSPVLKLVSPTGPVKLSLIGSQPLFAPRLFHFFASKRQPPRAECRLPDDNYRSTSLDRRLPGAGKRVEAGRLSRLRRPANHAAGS